jgi:hypothetical protein
MSEISELIEGIDNRLSDVENARLLLELDLEQPDGEALCKAIENLAIAIRLVQRALQEMAK